MSINAYRLGQRNTTPQSEPIPGENQVANNAGGFVYALDAFKTLDRFLILGSEGGTYYVKEEKLTKDNVKGLLACLAQDYKRTIDTIVAVSDQGRAPKNTPAEFALAIAAADPRVEVRKYALDSLPKVCRIPTHLFHFLDFTLASRGWSRGLRTAVSKWYRWDYEHLAHELVKYQSRDGWSHGDVLRLTHPKAGNDALPRWVLGLDQGARKVESKGRATRQYPAIDGELPAIVRAFEYAKTLGENTAALAQLIRDEGLTREMVPTEALSSPLVWEALLEKMPPHALLRNLGNLSKCGLLTPLSDASRLVVSKLGALDYRKHRVHPIAVLLALKTYGQGHGVLGAGKWEPVPAVVEALDNGFYEAFGALEPTGKRLLFALDVSGSMSSAIAGLPISCAEGAAVMAMACARKERDYHIMGFADQFRDLRISATMRLEDALSRTRMSNFGSTDCALPAHWARTKGVAVDGIIILTDSETWAGHRHPKQELDQYRREVGPVKQVVVGMYATPFTIADPTDVDSLDVVGFDTATPQVITEFLR